MPETVFYVFGIILSLVSKPFSNFLLDGNDSRLTCITLLCQGFFAFNYRLALHPLRKYPGPFLARLTDGYGGYHAMKKRLHLVTYIDHLKYGTFTSVPPRA